MTHLALSTGCPSGIGPEVSVAAAHAALDRYGDLRITLYGDPGALADAAAMRGLTLLRPRLALVETSRLRPDERVPGRPCAAAGMAQLAAVDAAADAVRAGHAQGLVTAPVSKRAITDAGVDFRGHTEHLAARWAAPRVVMMFAGPRLRTSLVTTHLPIARVPAAITFEDVRATVLLTAEALHRWWGLAQPRVGVSGLNPHAGEGGLLGGEEAAVIAPAVASAQAALGDRAVVVGPLPAEGVYRQARDGQWDAVVGMYHDQATLASKLLDFGDAVNVTLGLPFVRTSVDHGTAYDIAGRGEADARGMLAALALGRTLVASGQAHPTR